MRRLMPASLPLLAALLPLAASASRVPSVQEILLRAKPAVVLVVTDVGGEVALDCGSGTTLRVTPTPVRDTGSGWLVSGAGWVLTNAHVVRAAQRPDASVRAELVERAVREGCVPALLARQGFTPGERPDVESELTNRALATALPAARVRPSPAIHVMLPSGERLPATAVKYGAPVEDGGMSGDDLALVRVERRDLPALPLGDSTALQIGDPLWVLGFPRAVLSHELLNATAAMEASITKGAISGFKEDRAGQPVIQTDAPAAAGTSGGPAIDASGRVVGVLTFVTTAPGEGGVVQGFNFVIPAQAVRRFLAGTPVSLGERSRFDVAWDAALAAFFDGDHATAARRLVETNRLVPGLPDVMRLSAENAERLAHTAPAGVPWRLVGAGAVAVSLVGYGALAMGRRKRNRFRIDPADVARLLATPPPPIVLDVRDETTYARSPVRLPGAIRLTAAELDAGVALTALEVERTVIAYCT